MFVEFGFSVVDVGTCVKVALAVSRAPERRVPAVTTPICSESASTVATLRMIQEWSGGARGMPPCRPCFVLWGRSTVAVVVVDAGEGIGFS